MVRDLSESPKLVLIAAVSANNVIGKEGGLPWDIAEEIRFFKDTTLNFPVIMGRKTFDSIGKKLKNRANIIISKSKTTESFENLIFVNSIEKAIEIGREFGKEKIFIIGGGEIFNQIIDIADELIISRLPEAFEGDTFFPEIDGRVWSLKFEMQREKFKVEHYFRKEN